MSEQVKLLRTYNQWRRSEIEGSMDELGLHPTDIGKAIDAVLDDLNTVQADYLDLHSMFTDLQAECASLKNSILDIKTRHFAERWKQISEDSELEQYLSAGITQLEEERDAALAECERLRKEIDSWGKCYKEIHAPALREAHDYISELRAELAAIKAQEPVARANKGDYAFFVNWTESGKPLRGVIDLYTLPTINQQLTVK